eukprot:1378081-Pyramimonas_sp.AAC.1
MRKENNHCARIAVDPYLSKIKAVRLAGSTNRSPIAKQVIVTLYSLRSCYAAGFATTIIITGMLLAGELAEKPLPEVAEQ